MCLLLLAIDTVPGRPWLLLGNRDEFHARPTAPAQEWGDVFGGRDLQAGGFWLALNRNGRYAAVTNLRRSGAPPARRSRGALVGGFVGGTVGATAYAATVARERAEYGPFNLVAGDTHGACFVSSIDGAVRTLARGVHAFSNGSLEDEWPKMRRLREKFSALLQSGKVEDAALLDLLCDDTYPLDSDLPETGIGLELERRLASIFVMPMSVRGDAYGTRASTLAYARADGSHALRERRYGPDALVTGESALDF
ncbi:MAG: NRDE family protein [Proteobacteria bacterium]|uniref:NRDE family protein n=1 Tax=Rudaea sp. TaxID=2136325 RepID=UPI0037832780|nr:NRDE family protein [Pseudomonadota bacterium]